MCCVHLINTCISQKNAYLIWQSNMCSPVHRNCMQFACSFMQFVILYLVSWLWLMTVAYQCISSLWFWHQDLDFWEECVIFISNICSQCSVCDVLSRFLVVLHAIFNCFICCWMHPVSSVLRISDLYLTCCGFKQVAYLLYTLANSVSFPKLVGK